MTSRFAGFERVEVHGWPVLFRPDARFKTFRVVLALQRPLGGDAAARALLPALLQHGTRAHQDRMALARAKEVLFGAAVGPAVLRWSESVVLRLQSEAVAGAFLPGRPDQFGEALRLLQEYALRSRLQDGSLPAPLFERERQQALAAARAVYDDKSAYARQQALAAACRGEPYALPEHGGEAAIAALSAADAARALADFVQRGRRLCVAMGVLPGDLPGALAPLLGELAAAAPAPPPLPVVPARRPPGRSEEEAPMQQAKLVLVYRLPPPAAVPDLCALHACLSLWGGGAHSRLFREVRERRSLCYYAGASGDAQKGLVLVQVGCDRQAVGAVVAEVAAQLAELAALRFTDDELRTAVAAITGPLAGIDDTLAGRMHFTAEQWLLGVDQDPAARLLSYRAVDREALAAAARSLWLDHEFALLPAGGGA